MASHSASEARRFMAALFVNIIVGVIEIRALRGRNESRREWVRSVDEFEALFPTLQAWNEQGYNIYVGVNKRRDDSDGGAVNVERAHVAWAEADAGKNGTTEEILAAVDTLKLSPSVLVSSGSGGVHAYHLLASPVAADEGVRLNKGLRQALQRPLPGKLDSVADAARIMRIPGFRNHKPGAGDVKLLSCEDVRYSAEELARAFPFDQSADPTGGRTRLDVVLTPLEEVEDSEWCDDLLDDDGVQRLLRWYAAQADTSEGDFGLMCKLIESFPDLTDEQVVGFGRLQREEKGATDGGEDCKVDRPGYWARTLGNVRQRVAEPRVLPAIFGLVPKGDRPTDDDWPELQLWRAAGQPSGLPDFPVDALPDFAAEFARAAAESAQVPIDAVGVAVLGTLAAAVSGRYRVVVSEDYPQPLLLYISLVMRSGAGKSPALGHAIAPLVEYELQRKKQERDDLERHKAQRKQLEDERRTTDQQIARLLRANPTDADELARLRERDQELALEILHHGERHPYRLTADDATPEIMEKLLGTQERIAWMAHEGHRIWDLVTGAYGNKPNFDFMLKGYDRTTYNVDRITREPLLVEDPTLTVLVATQPTTVDKMSDFAGDVVERGLVPRFYWAWPSDTIGLRKNHLAGEVSSIPAATKSRYHRRVVAMVESGTKGGTIGVGLTDAAREVLAPRYGSLERSMGLGGECEQLLGWASKEKSRMLRVAGVLAVASNTDLSPPIKVEVEHARAAIRLSEYFEVHARFVYERISGPADPGDARARRLFNYLTRLVAEGGVDSDGAIATRELQRKAQGHKPLSKADAVRAGLRQLQDRGVVYPDTTCSPPRRWFVSPHVLADFG